MGSVLLLGAARFAARQEAQGLQLGVRVAHQFGGVAPGSDAPGPHVEIDAVAGDGEDAGQLVGDDDEGTTEDTEFTEEEFKIFL